MRGCVYEERSVCQSVNPFVHHLASEGVPLSLVSMQSKQHPHPRLPPPPLPQSPPPLLFFVPARAILSDPLDDDVAVDDAPMAVAVAVAVALGLGVWLDLWLWLWFRLG